MHTLLDHIGRWSLALCRSMLNEWRLIGRDKGVILFFVALPLFYPLVYTLIYNPELATELPMAVVDDCRSAESRRLVRMVAASQYVSVAGYASSLQEAREWARQRRVYSIMVIPDDYARRLGRGEQAVVPLFTDMSLLLRYRNTLLAMSDIALHLDTELRTELLEQTPAATSAAQLSAFGGNSEAFLLGDTTQGFASFIMVGVLVLILQQSAVLGVLMLDAGANERRTTNGGSDPEASTGPPTATLAGRTLAVALLYLPLTVWALHCVPLIFRLPHLGSLGDTLMLTLPMLLASTLLGRVLSVFATERESCFLVFVFTSVLFLFLSGLTWPASAMSPAWRAVASLLPSTWAIQGFVAISSNGATLAILTRPYASLWLLVLLYFAAAYLRERRLRRRSVAAV